jgi:hypothetical protein
MLSVEIKQITPSGICVEMIILEIIKILHLFICFGGKAISRKIIFGNFLFNVPKKRGNNIRNQSFSLNLTTVPSCD